MQYVVLICLLTVHQIHIRYDRNLKYYIVRCYGCNKKEAIIFGVGEGNGDEK